MSSSLLSKLNVPFTFNRRPEPLPPDLRPQWRIATLLLILLSSRGKRASFQKLHVLNWAVRTAATRSRFLARVRGERKPSDVIIRFEPGLYRALDLAMACKLVAVKRGKIVELTDPGERLAKGIEGIDNCLVEEKVFLKEVRPSVLERDIDALLRWQV